MGTSGFEYKRGLAYPPNVEPRLEAWMERVRVTLGKILDSSVDAARINAVTLDVDESGNVTAQITPNENTKWIEYYGLITDYPTLAQIVTSGTEVRVWDTPGETYTTGTLITLTDGQTYFFGAVAYEEEEADQENPALSTSVPVYAEITFSTGTADTDTIIPTVKEVVTTTGTPATSGTVTLTIIDPDTYVTQVSFRTWTGGTWNGWVDDLSFPFDNSEDVTMQEQHNVGIEWKVLYDLGGSRGVETISNVVMFDIDTNPELSEGYLTVDTTDGDVIYRYVGDDDTLSVKYATSATDWTTDALAKTAAEAGTAIDGRTGPATGGTVVHSSLAEGATRYVAVSANNGASGGGAIFGSQVYRYQITRPSDTTDDTIPPMVEGDVTYDGAGNATLVLEIDWGTYSTGTVEFKAKSGLGTWDVSWTEDTGPTPYEHSVVLDEKHASHIKYRLTYGGGLTLGDVVTIDVDRIPELQTAYVFIDDDGDAKLVWNGDDDVDYIVWQSATGASPSYPATWSNPPVISDGTRDPVAGNLRNNEVVVETGMTEGEECAVAFYMFRSTGENSMIPYHVRSSYRTDTDNPLPPIVLEETSEAGAVGTLKLTVTDPQGQDLSIDFWTRTGHVSWTGPDNRDPVTSGGFETDTVGLEEKKLSGIKYEVTNDALFVVGGEVTFDTDRIPDASATLDILTDGTVQLSWIGDSDLLSIRYHYAISSEADVKHFVDVTDPTSTGNYKNGRTGSGYIYENLDEDGIEVILEQGESIYVKVRGFTAAAGAGDYGELVQIPMTRPIDTSSTSNLINNGDFEAGLAYWGGLRFIGGGPIYPLYTATTDPAKVIDGVMSLQLLGQPSQAIYVHTSTTGENGDPTTIIAVEGDRITFAAEAYVFGAHTLTCYVSWYDSSKTIIGSATSILTWTETIATPKDTSVVAPANTAYCGFKFYIPADATDAKYAIVDNVAAQFKVDFNDYPVSALKDVATYSTTTDDVLTWTGSEWDSVAPSTGYYNLVKKNDFATMTPRGILNLREGTNITIDVNDDSGGDQSQFTINNSATGYLTETSDATITGSWTFDDNTLSVEFGTYAGCIDYIYGGRTDADQIVWARILDATVERWGWRYDVVGNVDDLYLLKDGTTEVMRFDHSASLVSFPVRPKVGTTNVALITDSPSVSLLSDIGDVDTGYSIGHLLYYGTSWTSDTPVNLDIVTDTSISVQQDDSHKGYLGNDNDINFEGGSGATVTVTDEGTKFTVLIGVDASGGSAYGENDGDYQIGIDANGGGSNFFRIRSGTYSGGTQIMTIAETGSMLLQGTVGDLTINGALIGGNLVTGTKWTCYNSGYATFGASNSGDHVQLEVGATSDRFHLYDGTNRDNITPLYGFATGTGGPGSVTANYGAIYLRYTA